jgi:hypothetical protein
MKFIAALLILIIISLNYSCDSTEPDELKQITIELEDISAIEAWVRVKSFNIELPIGINLFINSKLAKQVTLNDDDSVILLNSLLPNTNYSINASIGDISSDVISAVTIDTTSHDYNWEIFTFGEHSSSILDDIVIISENNILVVGKIYLNDSSGQSDNDAYNAVHWDGISWNLLRIKYYGQCSGVVYPPLGSIWAYEDTSFIVTNGGSIGWYDGTEIILDCDINSLLTGAINTIWGKNSNDIYVGGNIGNLFHYNGNSWIKIETGTELDIYNIYGFTNNKVDGIYAVAAKNFVSAERKLFKIEGSSIKEQPTNGIQSGIRSFWSKNGNLSYIVGHGLFRKYDINSSNSWKDIGDITRYYLYSIDGVNYNDIISSGSFGELLHFNGNTWRSYRNVTQLEAGAWKAVKIKDNIIVAVGYDNPKAKILIGKR